MGQGVIVEGGFIFDVNPSSGDLIEKIACSTPPQIDADVAAARAAQSAWQDIGLAMRHQILRCVCVCVCVMMCV